MQKVADRGSLMRTAIHQIPLKAPDRVNFSYPLSTCAHELDAKTSAACFAQVISEQGLSTIDPVSTHWVRRLTQLLPSDGSAFALACTMCV
jgi:hypothetical protein